MADETQEPDISPDEGPQAGDTEERPSVVGTLQLTLLDDGRLKMGGEIPDEATFYGMLEMAKESHHQRKMIAILRQGPPGAGNGGGSIVRPDQKDVEQAERSKQD